MPGHYKKKKVLRKNNKKPQKGGEMKKKICRCHMRGGKLLTPAQLKLLQRQNPDFRTQPVKQKGMGHCGMPCEQCGGDFLGIGKAFKKVGKSIVSNPLRLAAAIGSMGASELMLTPAQLFRDATGIKASKVLDTAAPAIAFVGGPEAALGSKIGSTGLKMVGLGKRR